KRCDPTIMAWSTVKGKCSDVLLATRTSISVIEKSCASLYKAGHRYDGVYTIKPDDGEPFQVRCDMRTDAGGWTVFQRRQNASVDFFRGWQEYKNGFGNLNGNFWLGLEKIHRPTQSDKNFLRVDLTYFTNELAYAEYGTFSVASESEFFKLEVGSFSGNARDSLSYHNNIKFTTKDKDNDGNGNRNCAARQKGGWWYKFCYSSNLNGQYLKAGEQSESGINWHKSKNDVISMKKTEMKTRPVTF
ncbi:Hypothetical predicted protein, partial [Paramuricea clavata]